MFALALSGYVLAQPSLSVNSWHVPVFLARRSSDHNMSVFV